MTTTPSLTTPLASLTHNPLLKECSINLCREVTLIEPLARSFIEPLDKTNSATIERAHHKSIFRLKSDEFLFKEYFSHFINHIRRRKGIKYSEVTKRANYGCEFQPVVKRLEKCYPQSNVNKMIYNKVGTLGMSNRKE